MEGQALLVRNRQSQGMGSPMSCVRICVAILDVPVV